MEPFLLVKVNLMDSSDIFKGSLTEMPRSHVFEVRHLSSVTSSSVILNANGHPVGDADSASEKILNQK